jgi:hypothetical protein
LPHISAASDRPKRQSGWRPCSESRRALSDDTMFAPLTAEETAVLEVSTAAEKPNLVPIVPVPGNAPLCRWRHPMHGAPVGMWPYQDADGRLIAYSARVEYVDTDGKREKEVYRSHIAM